MLDAPLFRRTLVAMRQMQPVLWTKGVVLTPQHLQVQDRFLEDLLQFQLSALTFAPWGFQRIEIDQEALANGELSLVAASGLFSDGLLFDFPGADAPPPAKSIEQSWTADQGALDIFLSVAKYRDNDLNVGSATHGGGARYVAEVLRRRDENTGGAEKSIQVARKNLRLLTRGESLEGSSTLPVARVKRTATGELQLDPDFVPPLIDVAASESLMAIVRRLVETLSARSSALAGTRRQRNQSLADFSITDVASFWLLYTINTHFPRLRHLFETRHGHPEHLFEAMSALAGALTTFSATAHPRQLPAYDHGNPGPCFASLDAILRDLLETVVPPGFVSLPLRSVRSTIYAVAIDQDRYLSAPQFYLAVRAGVPARELTQRVPEVFKVASHDQLDVLIRRSLPGLGLSYVPNPPASIQVKLDYHYFRLENAGPHWGAVTQSRNVAVHVPEDFADPQLELLIVLPPKS